MGSADQSGGLRFVFSDWAQASRFEFSDRARALLERVGSPAEAYFIRRLFESPSTVYDGGRVAHCRGVSVWVQQPCGPYRIDVVAQSNTLQLAIEVDGMQHWESKAKIQADYRRERYLLRRGYVVARFTASEVMSNATTCWREVFGVFNAHRNARRSA